MFYLWDAFHGAAPAHRRDPRWLWQIALLAVLGVVVIVLNLMARGLARVLSKNATSRSS